MLYYKDFATGKTRRTYGKPVRVERGGMLNAWGLVVENRCSEIWIPEYCLRKMGASEAHYRCLKAKIERKSEES